MKTLLLIDGSTYLYRAFHAMPDLRSPVGRPVGATYGVMKMLGRLEKAVDFDYSACVFDANGKTFRDELYSAYKANRPSMPEELVSQLETLYEVVKASGWPMLMIPGVEADDVIGTLAHIGCSHGLRVIISSSDKDMAQLVSRHVSVVNTMTNETLDRDGVKGKFGVPPELIVDYLTLVGDKVDNVPGVDKCGPKTAVKWLKEYGSLDAIIAQAEGLGGKVGENLRAALDWLPRGRELITIKCDVNLRAAMPHGIESLRHGIKNKSRLADLYQCLGFSTFYREVVEFEAISNLALPPAVLRSNDHAISAENNHSTAPRATARRGRHDTLLEASQLDAWLEKLVEADLVALWMATTNQDQMRARLIGVSFAVSSGDSAYLPLCHSYAGAPDQLDLKLCLAILRPWLEDESKKKCGYNLKYNRHVFANHGIHLAGVVDDSLLAAYVVSSHEHYTLEDLSLRYLGESTIRYEEICGKGGRQLNFSEVDVTTASNYAACSADITLRLNQYFSGFLTGRLREVYRDIDLPLAEVLFVMERHGVLIDRERLMVQSHELGVEMLKLENKAYTLALEPFNLNSPKQLQEILFGKLGISTKGVKKTSSGGYSTDESVLETLVRKHPLPQCILGYRGLAKLKSTYTDKLPRLINANTGRVHTNYAQTVTSTGRLASSDPNLQNIPVRTLEGRRVREAFIAPAGYVIVSADYSQIELRIMAHLSEDTNMLEAFANGEDIHRATAAEVFSLEPSLVSSAQRRAAKAINFGLIYGMTAFGLAAQLDISRSAAKQYIARYFMRYPRVAEYMRMTRETARSSGYVETVFGRQLHLPTINLPNPVLRAAAERAAINAPMQGTAADLIKLAMIEAQRWLLGEGLVSKLIMQVHDELVLEVPEGELVLVKRCLPEIMSCVAKLKVPLLSEVSVGGSWQNAH